MCGVWQTEPSERPPKSIQLRTIDDFVRLREPSIHSIGEGTRYGIRRVESRIKKCPALRPTIGPWSYSWVALSYAYPIH